MPLINLLNCFNVATKVHQDSLVFLLNSVLQALEIKSVERVRNSSVKRCINRPQHSLINDVINIEEEKGVFNDLRPNPYPNKKTI